MLTSCFEFWADFWSDCWNVPRYNYNLF